MSIKILVNGAHGKMGQETVKAISADTAFKLVEQTDHTDSLADKIKNSGAEVVVDFTTPTAVFKNVLTIVDAGAHPVIGTTGLTVDQIAELKQHCAKKKWGGIIAPNFSIGAVLMMQFAKTAAKFFPEGEIIEFHHPGKLDSPSGTAIKTAAMMAESRLQKPSSKKTHDVIPHARGATSHDIPIHAIRLPGVIADQEVLFGGIGETLSITHKTIHREAFMPGVLLACKKVQALKELVYGLENILD